MIAFVAVVGLLTVTPGMDTALILRTAAVGARRRAWGVVAGIQGGTLVWGVLTSAGVTALLTASHVAYEALRWAGADSMLPQFVPADANPFAYGVLLTCVHILLGTVWSALLITSAHRFRAAVVCASAAETSAALSGAAGAPRLVSDEAVDDCRSAAHHGGVADGEGDDKCRSEEGATSP